MTDFSCLSTSVDKGSSSNCGPEPYILFNIIAKAWRVQGLKTVPLPVGESLKCLWSDLEKRQGTSVVEVHRRSIVSPKRM